jgi:hypothetical protein
MSQTLGSGPEIRCISSRDVLAARADCYTWPTGRPGEKAIVRYFAYQQKNKGPQNGNVRSRKFEEFMAGVQRRNPGETEFHQAVYEVAVDIYDYIGDKEIYHEAQILRRMAEPDRVISFRVCWEDDAGNIRVQRGYRVQNNNAIGPYTNRSTRASSSSSLSSRPSRTA